MSSAPPIAAAGRNLDRLTSMRAFAALAVFAFHISQTEHLTYFGVAQQGSVGVTFFFVLSGFILVWAMPRDDRAIAFYRRRFARIYPSHFVMLCVAAVVPVVAVNRDWTSAVISGTLTQTWFFNPEEQFGMNGVSWSLSCEAFFYLCLPLILLFLRPAGTRLRWIVALSYLFCATLLGFKFALINPIVQIGAFGVGVVAALSMMQGWTPSWTLPTAAVVTGAIYGLATLGDVSDAMDFALLTVPFLAIIVAAASADIQDRRGWLTSRWLIYAGQVSFAFYLVHELVIINLQHELAFRGVPMALLCLAVSVLAAMALHHGVERPCQRLLRGKQKHPPRGSEADPGPVEVRQPIPEF